VLQLEPFTAALRRAWRQGRFHTPALPYGLAAPPSQCHADDTRLHLRDLAVDGMVVREIRDLYCRASNASINDAKSEGVCMGSHPPVVGREPVTGADFGQPDAPPRRSLGVPVTVDLGRAQGVVYGKRLQGLRLAALRWGAHPLSLLGRSLISKQVMANSLAFHVTFVPPSAPWIASAQAAINAYAARSRLPEDASLPGNGAPRLLPKLAVACQPPALGGLGLPHLASIAAAMTATVLVRWCSPGPCVWKALLSGAFARVAPHAGWGASWVFSRLPIVSASGGQPAPWVRALPERVLALVRAWRECGLAPLPSAPDSPFPKRALLLEPVYLSDRVRRADGQPFEPPPSAVSEPAWPFTLGQLAACAAPLNRHPDIVALERALPGDMAEALHAARAPNSELDREDRWWCTADTGAAATTVKHQDPALPATVSFFQLLSGGALVPVPAVRVPSSAVWVPACVLPAIKPRHRWTAADLEAYDTAPANEKAAAVPHEQRLLGPWSCVPIYPLAWGVGGVPLHQLTAHHLRTRLTQHATARQLAEHQPDFQPCDPLRPRLWEDAAHPGAVHLATLEARWDAQLRAASTAAFAPNMGPGTGWLSPRSTPSATASARGPPRQRQPPLRSDPPVPSPSPAPAPPVAMVAAAAPTVPPDPRPATLAYAAYWRGLADMHVSNNVKAFAYRLAHGAIPCGALSAADGAAFGGVVRRANGVCPCCAAAPSTGVRGRPLETYTHLFMECPTYRPALEWLCGLWQAVTGSRPPREARVLVADDHRQWLDAPLGARAVLWATLRTTLLYCIWCARASNDPAKQSAGPVVRAAVAALRAEMKLRFNRRALTTTLAPWVPRQLVRGVALEPPRQQATFADVWVASGLCVVHTAPGPGGASSCLDIRLSESFPVLSP
jgi:hypothetical protein